jgi:hypothetical protein
LSEIRATTISDAAGTGPITLTGQHAAKAWLNYNHPSNVVRESFNVSSVTDNATGHFTKNYTSNMSVNDHVVTAGGQETGGGPASDRFTCLARGSSRLVAGSSQFYSGDRTSPGTARDQNICITTSFGDLA